MRAVSSHIQFKSFLYLATLLLWVAGLCSCGDGSREEDGPPLPAVVPQPAYLDTAVQEDRFETQMAGILFKIPLEQKARAIETLAVRHRGCSSSHELLADLRSLFEKESLGAAGEKRDRTLPFVQIRHEACRKEGGEFVSLLIRGNDSSRRLIVGCGLLARDVKPGPGAFALELAAALDVMRVFLTCRVARPEMALPFDLELVVLSNPDPSMSFLLDVVPRGTVVLGVLGVEEVAPAKLGSQDLFVQVVPGEESTLRRALVSSLTDYLGKSYSWSSASFSADLARIPEDVCKALGQSFVPWCSVRAASSATDRTLLAPPAIKPLRRARTTFASAHEAAGRDEGLVAVLTDREFKTCVAVGRALTIGISRCRTAFP